MTFLCITCFNYMWEMCGGRVLDLDNINVVENI